MRIKITINQNGGGEANHNLAIFSEDDEAKRLICSEFTIIITCRFIPLLKCFTGHL